MLRIFMKKTSQTHNTYDKTRLPNSKKGSRKLNRRYTIEYKINSFKQENTGSAVGFNSYVVLGKFP